jgi:hypothetical protein
MGNENEMVSHSNFELREIFLGSTDDDMGSQQADNEDAVVIA